MFKFDPDKEYSWTGDFWYADDNPNIQKNHFGGTLKYSPESGFHLHIITRTIPESFFFPDRKMPNKDIHGTVQDLKNISLVNCLVQPRTVNLGKAGFSSIICTPEYIVKDAWVKNTDKAFTEISFHCPVLDYFFDSMPDWNLVYGDESLTDFLVDSKIIDGFRMKVFHGHAENSPWFPKRSRCKKYKALCDKINKAIEESPYKKELLSCSKAYPIIKITGKPKLAREYFTAERKMRRFFSALLLVQIHTDRLWVKVFDKSCEVFLQRYQKIDIPWYLKNGHSVFITLDDTKNDFHKIYSDFYQIMEKSGSGLLNILIGERIWKHKQKQDSDGHIQYCWIINTIGDWQCKYGNNKKGTERFQSFLKENLRSKSEFNKKIVEGLKKEFCKSDSLNKLGVKIGNVRNCLEHKKSPLYPKYKHIVENEIAINNLCELLFLVLMKALYKKIGIKVEEKRFDHLLSHLVVWGER